MVDSPGGDMLMPTARARAKDVVGRETLRSTAAPSRRRGPPPTGPSVVLLPVPASVRTARQFVRTVCASLGETSLEVAVLLTSELVTNAVLHARTSITVGVACTSGGARVSVTDDAGTRPVVRSPTRDRESGRGMVLVDALATSWGVHDRPCGKTVWFALDRYPGAVAAAG